MSDLSLTVTDAEASVLRSALWDKLIERKSYRLDRPDDHDPTCSTFRMQQQHLSEINEALQQEIQIIEGLLARLQS